MHTIHQPDPMLPLMNNNGMDTPAWLPHAVIAEVNLMHATPAGTIDAAIGTLDYFADLGVNCLWIDPINEMGHSFTYPNGYTNIGLDTVEPSLSGTDDYAAGWRAFGRFVDAAHERGLRVLLDVVTWGVSADIDVTRKITVGGEQLPIGRILQDPQDREAWSNWGGPKYLYMHFVLSSMVSQFCSNKRLGYGGGTTRPCSLFSFWNSSQSSMPFWLAGQVKVR